MIYLTYYIFKFHGRVNTLRQENNDLRTVHSISDMLRCYVSLRDWSRGAISNIQYPSLGEIPLNSWCKGNHMAWPMSAQNCRRSFAQNILWQDSVCRILLGLSSNMDDKASQSTNIEKSVACDAFPWDWCWWQVSLQKQGIVQIMRHYTVFHTLFKQIPLEIVVFL